MPRHRAAQSAQQPTRCVKKAKRKAYTRGPPRHAHARRIYGSRSARVPHTLVHSRLTGVVLALRLRARRRSGSSMRFRVPLALRRAAVRRTALGRSRCVEVPSLPLQETGVAPGRWATLSGPSGVRGRNALGRRNDVRTTVGARGAPTAVTPGNRWRQSRLGVTLGQLASTPSQLARLHARESTLAEKGKYRPAIATAAEGPVGAVDVSSMPRRECFPPGAAGTALHEAAKKSFAARCDRRGHRSRWPNHMEVRAAPGGRCQSAAAGGPAAPSAGGLIGLGSLALSKLCCMTHRPIGYSWLVAYL